MDELQLHPSQLANTRLAAVLVKRSSAFPYSWNQRWVSLSGNFIFVYVSKGDSKPKRVLCVDTATTEPVDDMKAHPFVFKLKTAVGGREMIFAAATAEDRERWMTGISNAAYSKMYNRTREAVQFLERCKDAVAPVVAVQQGIIVPPEVPSADGTVSVPPTLATGPEYEPYYRLKQSLSGSDVVSVILSLRDEVAMQQRTIADLHASREADAHATTAAAASASSAASDAVIDTMRREIAALRDTNNSLNSRVTELQTQLRSAPTLAKSASTLAQERATAEELNQLRARVQASDMEVSALQRELQSERKSSSSREAMERERMDQLQRDLQEARSLLKATTAASNADVINEMSAKLQRLQAELTAERERANRLAAASAAAVPMAAAAGAVGAMAGQSNGPVMRSAPSFSSALSGASGSSNNLRAAMGAAAGGGAAAAGSAMTSPPPSAAGSASGAGGHVTGASMASGASSSLASPPTSGPTDTGAAATAGGIGGGVAGDASDLERLYEHEWAPFLAEATQSEANGNLLDAEQQYNTVLELKRERCGPDSVPAAAAHRDLARVLALQHKFSLAEEHYSIALKLSSELLGEAHPTTACALTDLAAVLREQNKFEDAEYYAKRAVSSLKAGVGADDVSTATALYNLAGLSKRQGKYGDAEASYAEALTIFRDKLGDAQGETADTLYQMGCLYRKRNDYSRAEQFFTQAADSYSKTYGASDKRVAEALKRARNMTDKMTKGGSGGGGGNRKEADD